MADEDFSMFLARVRAGDERAAADLVERYGSAIRREVRIRMTDPSLQRTIDDEDICQSVLASFFVRASLGQFDLHDPAQLRGLLLVMARNKVAHAARRLGTQKRGGGVETTGLGELTVPGPVASPSRVVAGRELLERVRSLLTEDERRVADLRGQEYDWAEIARRLGGTADGRRMQLVRALDRISRDIGLGDHDD